MSNMLKCPNPTCPYVFDPSQVPVGVVLSCPRCGMQFTLGAPAPAAATAPPPGFPSGRSAAVAPPPAAPNPEFEAAARTAVEGQHPDDPPPGHRANRAQVFILAGIASVLMAGTALTIYYKLTHRPEDIPADTVSRLHDLNIAVDSAPTGWTRDDAMRVKLGSPFIMSYKRENPEAYMAFGASEAPKGRSPRASEMRTNLLQALPKLFVEDKDNDTVRPEKPVDPKWLGEELAQADPYPNGFKFKAQSPDGLIWVGEAYTVAHKGISYYWMSWCVENDFDALRGEFAAFRGKFKLLDVRSDWKETQSNVIDYKGDKVSYTISDAEELWKEVAATDFAGFKIAEPDLDRRLRIRITPKNDRHARADEAELSVYILDSNGDPLQVAHQFAVERETARLKSAGDYTLTFKELAAGDELQGDPAPKTAPAPAPYVRLVSSVKESLGQARLFVVSGITAGNKTVVVVCWCEAAKRSVFETKFAQIASSLR